MKRFLQLVTELCSLVGFPEPRHLLAGEAMRHEDVNFAMTVNPQSDADALLLYADFGCLDLENKAMLYPLMLKENFMMTMASRNCTFAVSETHDSVVLIERLSLSLTTSHSLLAQMRAIAHKANYFNKQHRRLQPAAFRATPLNAALLRSELATHHAAS